MQEDYEMANDRFALLKEKYDKLQYEHQKDKQFYEEGLEARMNQMEELEGENERLQRTLQETKKQLLEQEGRAEQLEFDLDQVRKSAASGANERGVLSKKEEKLARELADAQE